MYNRYSEAKSLTGSRFTAGFGVGSKGLVPVRTLAPAAGASPAKVGHPRNWHIPITVIFTIPEDSLGAFRRAKTLSADSPRVAAVDRRSGGNAQSRYGDDNGTWSELPFVREVDLVRADVLSSQQLR